MEGSALARGSLGTLRTTTTVAPFSSSPPPLSTAVNKAPLSSCEPEHGSCGERRATSVTQHARVAAVCSPHTHHTRCKLRCGSSGRAPRALRKCLRVMAQLSMRESAT